VPQPPQPPDLPAWEILEQLERLPELLPQGQGAPELLEAHPERQASEPKVWE
jgi:hypothetical protein